MGKKILFVSSLESDYLQDLTYRGLVQKFSTELIIDFPWNKRFHLPQKEYPRNLGYQNFNLSHVTQRFTGLDWLQIGCVFVGAAKPDCFESYRIIQSQIPSSVPVIFLDGGDFPDLGGDLWRLKRPDLYLEVQNKRPFDFVFKREMLIAKDYPVNVAPLVFAVPTNQIRPFHFEQAELKYKVSFWAVESDPVRTRALGLIEDRFDCRENGTTKNQVFKKYKRKGRFYLEELARCQVVLNFRGVGWDTLRYWEVFGLGRFLISQKPQIRIPDNFEDKNEIVFCRDDGSDLIELCEYYLAHAEEREAIARAGFKKALLKHSELARATYVFEVLREAHILA